MGKCYFPENTLLKSNLTQIQLDWRVSAKSILILLQKLVVAALTTSAALHVGQSLDLVSVGAKF